MTTLRRHHHPSLRRRTCSLLGLVSLLALPRLTAAAPVVPDDSFDDAVSGWQSYGPTTISWASGADRRGHPDSGALRAVVGAGFSSDIYGPCITLDEGTESVLLGFWARLETAATEPATAHPLLVLYRDEACTDLFGNTSYESAALRTNAWARNVLDVPTGDAGIRSVQPHVVLGDNPTGTRILIDDVTLTTPRPSCIEDHATLCLKGGRFRVRAAWEKPDGTIGGAEVIPVTGDTGLLWFFNPANIEVTIKVIDGCPVNDHFWVFASGLTNVGVTLVVDDTLDPAAPVQYLNPVGATFAPILDTTAIPCTPP